MSVGSRTIRRCGLAVPVGIAAAVVQVIGLLAGRCWCPDSPRDAASGDPAVAAAARDSFVLAHHILGNLDRRNLRLPAHRRVDAAGRGRAAPWLRRSLVHRPLGAVSAVLILAGVLSPLNLPLIDDANFIGYVLWSVWLVIFAVMLLIGRPRTGTTASDRADTHSPSQPAR